MPIHPLVAPLIPLAAVIPVLTGQTGGQQSSDVEVVGLQRDGMGRMTVPVRIAEGGPYDFLIDTGAQNTVLSTDLAARLTLPTGKRAKLVGVAGTTMVDTVQVDQLDLGKRTFYGLLTPLLDARNIGADGILGLDSLQGQRVLIDFDKRLMAIEDAKQPGVNRGFDIVITARRRSGQLIMTNARIDGVWTDVVIDTGAEQTIGNRALQQALARRNRKVDQIMLGSVTGQDIRADIGYGARLTVNDMNINNVSVAFADSPAFSVLSLDKRPAILLGMRELKVFKRIAIDFATRKIYFDIPPGAQSD